MVSLDFGLTDFGIFLRSLSSIKLVDLKISGANVIPKIIAPRPRSVSGLMKYSLNENMPIINSVEKGREQAKMFNPKLTSNVGIGCSSFSSIDCMALMWAKGQKLQALCGKTTKSRIIAGVNAGIV